MTTLAMIILICYDNVCNDTPDLFILFRHVLIEYSLDTESRSDALLLHCVTSTDNILLFFAVSQ